jgi:hypothetical protein
MSTIETENYMGVATRSRRHQMEVGRGFRFTEEDVLRASRAVLPIANSMISATQVIFSGEPSMTLKVRLKSGSMSGSTAKYIVFTD